MKSDSRRSARWPLLTLLLLTTFSAAAEAPAAAAPRLVPVTLADWPATLKRYRPSIVVVDMWATWCDSCIKRFPHMVQMQRQYRDRDVRFVSLLLEDPDDEDARDQALAFLKRQAADFDHFALQDNLMLAFESLDLLGIPAVLVYDASGKEAARLTGDDPRQQFTEDDVRAVIERLLANAAP